MYRIQWYHRFWFYKTWTEQKKEAVRYVQGRLAKLDEKSAILSQALLDFVFPPSVSYKALAARLSNIAATPTGLLTQTSVSLLHSQEIEQDDPTEFLKSHEIAKGKQISQGAQGRIYSIIYKGNEKDYLYKEELHPHPITDPKDVISGHKFYRISGDIAAARCRLPNTVESAGFLLAGFLLEIIKNPKEVEESALDSDVSYHYLSNCTTGIIAFISDDLMLMLSKTIPLMALSEKELTMEVGKYFKCARTL